MQKLNKKGFTLIEVILFLAISSALTAIAFIGLAPRLRNVRFTSAVRGLEASITNEFSNAVGGINTRTGSSFGCGASASPEFGTYPLINNTSTVVGASSDCVLNGSIAVFSETSVTYYSIISLRKPVSSNCTATGFAETLQCYRSRIVRGVVTNAPAEPPEKRTVGYENAARLNTAASTPLAFGYIQDPTGTKTYQFFHSDANLIETNGAARQLSTANTVSSNTERSACMNLDTRTARFTFNTNALRPIIEFGDC